MSRTQLIEFGSCEVRRLTQLSSADCIWIGWAVLPGWHRCEERLKIDFGSNADLHMSLTKCIIMLNHASASIGVIFPAEHAQIVVRIKMSSFRAAVSSPFTNDEDDSCMSCLGTTKYCCLLCKYPLCNKCSVPEVNEETPGWKAGKSVAYCEPCSNEAANHDGNPPKQRETEVYPRYTTTLLAIFCLQVAVHSS